MPRYSKIARRAVELGDEQILAANVDFVFIVTAANRDFNINRIRRYLLLADRGACQPILVLSKYDLTGGDALFLEELACAFPHVPAIATSIVYDSGFQTIKRCLTAGQTGVFVGSSGVGKSTLINKLVESDMQATGKTRGDEKGRHTTSGAALFFLEGGGMIIDTPGLREVGLVGETDQLDAAMPSVPELASGCRFSDCSHTSEPGCAVQDALASGGLDETEYGTYKKLVRELAYTERKNDRRLAAQERKRWKQIEMNNRRAGRYRGE